MKAVDLRQRCKEQGVKQSGTKAEMTERLLLAKAAQKTSKPRSASKTSQAAPALAALLAPETTKKRSRSPAGVDPAKKQRVKSQPAGTGVLVKVKVEMKKPVQHVIQWRQLLGVKPADGEVEIKAAWRRGALKHHPDKGGSADMYLQIQEAYHGLINMIGVSQVQEERTTDVDIRAQLAARVFLHEVMEGLTSWPDLLPGLSDAVLQYLHAILTYEPCAARAPSKMAGTTGIMSASKGYSVKVGWSGWFVLSTVVSSLEEALDIHEALVTLRSLASRRTEAQSRAMPMEAQDLWEVLGTRRLPPAMFLFYSDKGKSQNRCWTLRSFSAKSVRKCRKKMDKVATDTKKLDSTRKEMKKKLEEEKLGHKVLHAKMKRLTEEELCSRGLIGPAQMRMVMPLPLPSSVPQPATYSIEERRARTDGVCDFICKMGATPSDHDVLAVLQGWGFAKNMLRPKLCKDGRRWCNSDVFGLSKMQGVHIALCTERFTAVHKFLAAWICWKLPEAVFTTIVVNYDFECQRHRDGKNLGPTVLLALGSFTGGALRVWPGDSGVTDVGKLKVADAKVVELEHQKCVPYLFDGNCAHEVLPFEGERFTVMAFSLKGNEAATSHEVEKLKQMGYPFPTDAGLVKLRRMCGPVVKDEPS